MNVIEATFTSALAKLTTYYRDNQPKANTIKTQVSLFHLRNAWRKLKISWNGIALEHTDHAVYLGVTLDRLLSFKQHIEKVKGKVRTRNKPSKNWQTPPGEPERQYLG